MLTGFPRGLYAHVRGLRFVIAHKRYLLLTAVPFALTLLLFAAGMGVFAANDDKLLALVWTPQAAETVGALGALYWLYVHVAKTVLYALAFVLFYFLFMVVANILASPVYDAIAERMVRELRGEPAPVGASLPFWRVMLEEAKKAVFVAVLPLLLVLVPVVGQLLAPVAAAFLLAFDFLDYACARDEPRFAARLRAMARRPLTLLGFGLPLLVPLLNIVLFPCAICGATLLYLDVGQRDGGNADNK